MQAWSEKMRRCRRKIYFVPTMGALHEGHLELARTARRANAAVVVSIFVNPSQFGPKEDYRNYPRTLQKDLALLRRLGVDAVFAPTPEEMYPEKIQTSVVPPNEIADKLCGKSRPGHFTGVATVIAKLFNVVKPHAAIFGQKDAQQCAVIKKLAGDLNFDVEIKVKPTVRARDGFALSSRNAYLDPQQRKDAVALYKSLLLARNMIKNGIKKPGKIKEAMAGLIRSVKAAKIDYIALIDPVTLEDIKIIKNKPVLAVLAVYIGRTRLIDNMVV